MTHTAHDASGLVRANCTHGADRLVVDLVDTHQAYAVGRVADGRMVVAPRAGSSFIRSKYLGSTGLCPVCPGSGSQPRPDDLTTPALSEASCGHPTVYPEPYIEAVHGEVLPL